jgi:hypothetical protein
MLLTIKYKCFAMGPNTIIADIVDGTIEVKRGTSMKNVEKMCEDDVKKRYPDYTWVKIESRETV